jgi:hypothetical protein
VPSPKLSHVLLLLVYDLMNCQDSFRFFPKLNLDPKTKRADKGKEKEAEMNYMTPQQIKLADKQKRNQERIKNKQLEKTKNTLKSNEIKRLA